jgi:hypothetical protein
MTTSALNLAPLVDGYKWLEANPEHFNMRYFLGERVGIEESCVTLYSTSTAPKCGTILCLAGAILLANALKKGETSVYISPEPSRVMAKVMKLIGEVNQWEFLSYPNMYPYFDVRKGLYDIFMGDVFLDWEANEKYPHINRMSDITLKDLKKELDSFYSFWGYVPEQ